MNWLRRSWQISTGLWVWVLLRVQADAATDGAQIYFVEDGLMPRVEQLVAAGLWKDLVAAAVAVLCVAAMFCLALRQKKGANN